MSLGAVQILQKSLQDAQKGLNNTDDEIRRLTGREPTRPLRGDKRDVGGRMRAWSGEYLPPAKRRQLSTSDRPRVSDRLGNRRRESGGGPPPHSDEEEEDEPSNIKSSVVAAPVPPRPTADPTEDKTSKKRNQRMFGFLMGTLQKFQRDSNQRTEQEKRRAEIEEKLEQAAAKEKQEIAKQRKELYEQRRHHQQRIGFLIDQVEMAEVYEEWNVHDRRLMGFIKTKSKPPIFYLPAQHNEATEKLLLETQKGIEETIAIRKDELEKVAAEQAAALEDPLEPSNEESDIKSRSKVSLGREVSSNEESDKDD